MDEYTVYNIFGKLLERIKKVIAERETEIIRNIAIAKLRGNKEMVEKYNKLRMEVVDLDHEIRKTLIDFLPEMFDILGISYEKEEEDEEDEEE